MDATRIVIHTAVFDSVVRTLELITSSKKRRIIWMVTSPIEKHASWRIVRWFSRIRHTFPFATNVVVLTGGASMGHLFTVLTVPLLTRLYSPSDIGNLGLFSAFLNMTGVIASLQYDAAIVSARSQKTAAYLVKLSTLLIVPVSVTCGLALHMMIHFSLLGFGVLPDYAAWLMIPAIICVGIFSTLRYWSLREDEFGIVSQAMVLQNGGRSLLQVALGAIGTGSFGLLTGEVLGRGIGMTRMARNAWPVIRRFSLSCRYVADVLVSNRRFPLYSMPSSLLNQLGVSLPLPLLVALYGSDAGGYYTLVWRVLALPVVLVGASIADAFHSRAASYAREDPARLLNFFYSTSVALLILGGVPALIVFLWGQSLFTFVFGATWRLSGTIATIVAPWFLTSFVVSPLSRLVYVLDGQRLKLIYDVLILGGNVLVFFIARKLGWGMLHMLTIMSGINTLSKIVYYLVLLRIAFTGIRQSPKETATAY
jgi:lipopolysaccharide exporter